MKGGFSVCGVLRSTTEGSGEWCLIRVKDGVPGAALRGGGRERRGGVCVPRLGAAVLEREAACVTTAWKVRGGSRTVG